MRFHFDDIRRAKRLARALQKELAAIGIKLGLTAVQDLTARLYGYSSHHELKSALGSVNPSPWDEQSPDAVVDARREHQVHALAAVGCGRGDAERIIATLRPTGRRGHDASQPPAPETAAVREQRPAAQSNLDSLLSSIHSSIGRDGCEQDKSGLIHALLMRAYEGEYGEVEIRKGGDRHAIDVSFDGFSDSDITRSGSAVTFDEYWQYFSKRTGIHPRHALGAKGEFTLRQQEPAINLKVEFFSDSGNPGIQLNFVERKRTRHTLDDFEISNRTEWLDTFDGMPGLHVVCSRQKSRKLVPAMIRDVVDNKFGLFGGISESASVLGIYRPPVDGKKPKLTFLHTFNPRRDRALVLGSIVFGHTFVLVADGETLEEALLTLYGMGYDQQIIKKVLRSVIHPVAGKSEFSWQAHVFPVDLEPCLDVSECPTPELLV